MDACKIQTKNTREKKRENTMPISLYRSLDRISGISSSLDPYGKTPMIHQTARLDARLDLSSFASVQDFASSMDRPIDLLVCLLARIMGLVREPVVGGKHGLEMLNFQMEGSRLSSGGWDDGMMAMSMGMFTRCYGHATLSDAGVEGNAGLNSASANQDRWVSVGAPGIHAKFSGC